MNRIGPGILAVALAGGCFSVPPYEPTGGLSYTEEGTGATVAGPGFALRFAGGEGFHFPDALMIGENDMMGHDPAALCFREDGIGVLISPTARISATGPAEPVASRLDAVLRGPAVVQVKVEWTTRLGSTCVSTRRPGGVSTFTVFPDGQIVRHDTFSDVDSTLINPVPCACQEPTDSRDQLFNLSTFWTLAKARFIDLSFVPGENPTQLPGAGEGGLGGTDVWCVNGGTYQVGFAWPAATNTRIRTTEASIVLDRQIGQIGRPDITVLSEEDRSAIFIERGGCDAALARGDAYLTPPQLAINGAQMMPALDGIYGGGGLAIEPAGDLAVVEGVGAGAFAVWLRFSRPSDAVRATRADATGAWYVPQRVGDREWIVWFRGPLPGRDKIEIEPF